MIIPSFKNRDKNYFFLKVGACFFKDNSFYVFVFVLFCLFLFLFVFILCGSVFYFLCGGKLEKISLGTDPIIFYNK